MKHNAAIIYIVVISYACIAVGSTTDTYHTFFLGNYYQRQGNLKQAKKAYQHLVSAKDTPIDVYKGYLPLMLANKEYTHIVQLMPSLKEHFKNDPEIMLVFAQALEATGNSKDADALYVTLSRQFPHNQEIVYHAVLSYRRQKQGNNALSLLDEHLNNAARKPNNFIFHFMKAQLHTELQHPKEALASVQETLNLHPGFDKGWLLLGMLEEQAGELDNAINGYTTFLELSGMNNKQLEKHLLELLLKKRMVATKEKSVTVNNKCLLKGLSLFEQKQYKEGLKEIDNCLKQDPQNKDARLLKIDTLNKMGKTKKAARLLAEYACDYPHDTIWTQQLRSLSLSGLSQPRVFNALHTIQKKHPYAPLVHLTLAHLYTDNNQYERAIFHYRQSLHHEYEHRKQHILHINYTLACLYHYTNQYDVMLKLLDDMITYYPDFNPAKHLRAYHALTHEYNYRYAKQLLREILHAEPFNEQYRLTYAHLLYEYDVPHEALRILNHTMPYAHDINALSAYAQHIAKETMQDHHLL